MTSRLTPVIRAALILLLLVVALAACGGGTKTYTDSKTRSCLVAHGAKIVTANDDIVAETATGGAFRARLPDNFVTVVFGATVADADNINDAYHRFKGKNVGIDDVLNQQGNVLMLWHLHPQDVDLNFVTACLKLSRLPRPGSAGTSRGRRRTARSPARWPS